LLGIASILVASKYEEIYAPEVKDLLYITDNAYRREDLLKMEQKLLATLDFNVTFPSMHRLLERYSKLAESDDLVFNYCKYLVELSLMEIRMYKWTPSLIACSAIYLSKKIMRRNNPWSEFMFLHTGHSESEIRDCSRELCYLLKESSKADSYSAAIFRKYMSPRFLEVSRIVPGVASAEQS